MLVSVSDNDKCVSDTMVTVCVCLGESRCVCVCHESFQWLSVKLSSGCLFSPHHVNQGDVQKDTLEVPFPGFHLLQ
jgi:hypothetical protein